MPIVFLLLLCCVFVFCLLAVLLTGTQVYRQVATMSDDGYGGRTVLAYVETKLRGADFDGAISVGKVGGSDALLMTERFENLELVTAIYSYEGNLCELYTIMEENLDPKQGEAIIEAPELEITEEDGLVTIRCGERSIRYSVRSQEVGQ